MLDYIHAELYKVFHRKYPYGFLLAMFLCEGLLVWGWAFTNARGNDVGFQVGAGIMVNLLNIGLFCTILIGDIVFSEQYKFNTMKNEVSYGVPRARIYLGKLIVQCITALLLCAVVVAFYLGLCWLVLPHDPALDAQVMQMVGYCLLVALPLWLGAQALVNMVYFLIKSTTVASFLVVGIFMGAGEVFKLLGALVHPFFQTLYSIMLTSPFEASANAVGDWAFFGRSAAVGAGWFVAATVIGLLLFRKKEIN